ncbi:MAG: hypothetical protein ACRC4W_02935 [Treponemataceae bacterium]
MRKIDIVVANPSGNITVFVKTPTEQKDYLAIAAFLLGMQDLKAQQVAFIVDDGLHSCRPQMNMAGMEFCANASRAFALLLALENPAVYKSSFSIHVSGCNQPLGASVDTQRNNAKISLPLNIEQGKFVYNCKQFFQASFDGITHLVVFDIPYSANEFLLIKNEFYKHFDAAAFGVMFVNEQKTGFVPVIFVRDVNSIIIEGSCGSGSVATALALCETLQDGEQSFSLHQPAGVLQVVISKKQDLLTNISLEGEIFFSNPMTVEIDV